MRRMNGWRFEGVRTGSMAGSMAGLYDVDGSRKHKAFF